MVFGNLWMLVVGGSFVAVPILLHLIMQQKPKPMLFPAVRFLRETFASNQRRLKLKQWVLLMLRALVIVWLAAALAQPSGRVPCFGVDCRIRLVADCLVVTRSVHRTSTHAETR